MLNLMAVGRAGTALPYPINPFFKHLQDKTLHETLRLLGFIIRMIHFRCKL